MKNGKNAEESSSQSRGDQLVQWQAQAMDASMDGIAILNKDEEYLYLNPAHAAIYGYEPGELIGKTWRVLYNRDEVERFEDEIFPSLVKAGRWRGEAIGCRKDGSLFPQEVSLTVLDEGGLICVVRDISERIQTLELKHANEERFRLLAELAPVGIVISDSEERTLYISPEFIQMFGYDLSDMPSVREWWMLAYPDPDIRDRIKNDWKTIIEEARNSGGDTPVLEGPVTCKDGSVRQIEFRLASTGDLNYIVYTDVTRRKQDEDALLERENRLQSVLRTAPIGIGVVTERIFQHVNQRLCEMTGYPEEELIGRSARVVYPDQEEYEFVGREKYEQILKFGSGTVETRWKHKDGPILDVLLSSTPVDLEDLSKGVTFTALDITDRKQTEQALRESDQRFQNILGVVPDMISIHDPEMKILYSNWQGFASVPEERRIRNTKCYHTYRGYDEICPDCRAKQVLETGSAFQEEVQLPDGSWIDMRVIPLLDKNGKVEIFMEWVRDITEQKEAAEERERLQVQLNQAQKIESIGRLAGGVAHDFNNMLNVILSHTEIALEDMEPTDPLRTSFKEIQSAARRSADLTRQLLAFARRQTVAPRVLDLNATVGSMMKMLERLIGEDIDLSWQPATRLEPVRIDPAQIDQILANLVVNARDAIENPGGRISIETAAAEFDEDFCSIHQDFLPGCYVKLSVSDNGCGMDEEILAQVFEPFFTTKGVGKGTGLGLATVYGIVRQNEGFINIYSEPGQGTSICIYLPAYRAEHGLGAGDEGKEPVPITRGQETILLVEDESAILTLGVRILERLGYEVLSAATPGEAIRLAREHSGNIDLLITDVVMPEMNGRDLARNLLSIHPAMKRLFMSGYTADVIAHQGVLDKGVNFLQKPFSISDLSEQVRSSLDSI